MRQGDFIEGLDSIDPGEFGCNYDHSLYGLAAFFDRSLRDATNKFLPEITKPSRDEDERISDIIAGLEMEFNGRLTQLLVGRAKLFSQN